jgi:ABC-2 type transport system ATP-binding protein
LGIDVCRQPHDVRERIGLAGQYAAVDENLTGRENLIMVGRLAHQPRSGVPARADELLGRFRLARAADRTVKTYSGGMRRRLDLAAALVHRPPVLFLDEPTTGLDPRGRLDLWGLIEELVAEGATVLLTTQYLEEADRLADRIAVVDGGRVIAEGTAAELKAQLGSTIIRVEVADPATADAAKAVLAEIGPTDLSEEGRAVEVKVTDSGRSLITAVRKLDDANIAPVAMTVREPSLDDVFLTLTGRPSDSDQTGGEDD